VLLMRSVDWAVRLARIIEEFGARVRSLYTPADVARGGIEALDRYGQRRLFPLLTLSIAIVDSAVHRFRSADEVSEWLQAAKRRAKAIEGNCLWYEGAALARNLLDDPELLGQAGQLPQAQARDSASDSGTYDELLAPLELTASSPNT
jgi:hypothetical protein